MPHMTKEDIMQLGELSRIALSPTEIERLQTEIDSIVAYVSTVRDIAEGEVLGAVVGARYNVLRPDMVTTTPGAHTETLLKAMPHRDGQFMSVKKILNQN
jgi:aspartyl/glutamyl-tRNA(Asn/Gln) amidotransferase C subunit